MAPTDPPDGDRVGDGDDGGADDGAGDRTGSRPAATPEAVEREARRLERESRPFVRATVVRREPPVSATVGARAVVTADGDLVGWIGGVECAQSTVVREALSVLETGQGKLIGLAPDPRSVDRPGVETFRLTCHSGGTLEVFLDPVVPAPRLLVVGGSPIAAALVGLAARTGYDVTVVDPGGDPAAYPDAATVLLDADPAAVVEAVGTGAFVAVASAGEYDAEGVAAAVALGAPYVGLVASERRADEVAEAAAELLEGDEDPATVRGRVTSPAGVEIGAETPEEIAVSILAQLVAVRRSPDGTRSAGAERSAAGTGGETADRERSPASTGGEADDGGDERETARDPVCGMSVPVADPAATVDHGGTTYYFCSRGCADAFSDDPEEHLTSPDP